MLTVAVPSLLPPRMRSRWILFVWWGVAALSSAGHLVFFNLVDSDDDFTWFEVQLAESRLHALQMQLNPHFLAIEPQPSGDSSLRLCSGAVLRVSRARLAELNARLGIG